jgi:uncharacterized protein related to proFAR isomerase
VEPSLSISEATSKSSYYENFSVSYVVIVAQSDLVDMGLCSSETTGKVVLKFSSNIQETETCKHKEAEAMQLKL